MTFVIQLFTRYPLAGKSKTRLIPALGPKGAAHLQKNMTEQILSTICALRQEMNFTLEIHYDGASQARMQSWLGHSFLYKHQRKESLGDRMTEAMRPHLQYSSGVLLIGSDCPDINTAILQEALLSLTSHKVVLGPTHDGGYYLIGVSGHLPAWQLQHLFEDIPWGTETVFKRTLDTIKRHHLNYHLVKKLHDIDTPEDLRYIDYHPDTQ